MLEPRTLSYHSIRHFRECPQSFKFWAERRDRLPEPPLMLFGKVAHELFYRYGETLRKKGRASDLELARSLAMELSGELPPALQEDLVSLAEKFALNHFFSEADAQLEVGAGVRIGEDGELELKDFDDPEATVRGRIDYLLPQTEDGRVLVVDYKTSWNLPPKSEAFDEQLYIYSVLALALYPEAETISLVLDFVRYDAKRVMELTKEQALWYAHRLRKLVKRIWESEEFPAQVGAHCETCLYAHHCDAIKNLDGSWLYKTIKTPEEAREMAERYLLLNKAVKHLKKALEVWVNSHGAIELGDGSKLGYKPRTKTTFPDSKRVINALLDAGVERDLIWEKLSISKTAVQSIMKKAKLPKEVRESIMDLAEVETETRFELIKGEREKGE
mgnify:CR=1 FL=1